MLIQAAVSYIVAGRALGKSEGILAPKSANNIITMPRGTGIFVSSTFQQQLTRTLPAVIAGWEKLGYIQGKHYLIGVKPPEKWRRFWKCPGPYRPPQKSYEYFISWWNGAGIQMVSQDRIGSSNGVSIDWIMGDEAKLLNRERLTGELFPANRGIIPAFANNVHHHGLTFTTDMPVGTGGRWILDKEKEMDVKRVNQILKLQATRLKLVRAMAGTANIHDRKSVNAQLQLIDLLINDLRKDLVHFYEASTLENIHGLGIKYFRDQMRDLSEFEFKTSILNRRPTKIEDGFYPDLNEDHHGYFAYDYHKFETTGYDLNALSTLNGAEVDADYDPLKTLNIALDYNRAICPMVVGQIFKNKEIRAIKGIHCEYPLKLNDTLHAFCKYYKHHVRKVVNYWYDHTAIGETANSGSYADDVVNYLTKEGWTVIRKYIGQASGHERRYTMYSHLLQEDGHYPYYWRVNRDRCPNLLLSMYQAQAIYNKKGFGKNKKPEQDPNFPADEATHYSEANDMMLFGILESGLTLDDEPVTRMDYTFV